MSVLERRVNGRETPGRIGQITQPRDPNDSRRNIIYTGQLVRTAISPISPMNYADAVDAIIFVGAQTLVIIGEYNY